MAAEADIPDSGAVFTFGRSRFVDNVPDKFWVRNDPISQLSCGDQHTALVTESGRIFMFGPNDWGQLGLGHTNNVDKPCCIKALKHEKVTLVSCGGCHTLLATDSGKIYAFGANGEGQLGVTGLDKCVEPYHINKLPQSVHYKAIAAGFEHSLCLTENGVVYVWGSNSEGQLGLGDIPDIPVPTKLHIDVFIATIAAGYYHTALLTDTGCVYLFGECEGGKLGLGDKIKTCYIPTKLVSFDSTVKSISCGSSHTAFITKQGELYTFGTGSNGELGHGTYTHTLSLPLKVNLPYKVQSVSCGANHTAIVSEAGHLYTFGDGRHGKLAQGEDSYSNLFKPCLVDQFETFTIDRVVCGGCHMMVVAHRNSLLHTNTLGNINSSAHTIRDPPTASFNNSADLTGTLSARDRRRQTTEINNSSWNRTLPSLIGKVSSGNILAPISLKTEMSLSSDKQMRKSDIILPNGKCFSVSATDSAGNQGDLTEPFANDYQNTPQSLRNLAPKPAPRTLRPNQTVVTCDAETVTDTKETPVPSPTTDICSPMSQAKQLQQQQQPLLTDSKPVEGSVVVTPKHEDSSGQKKQQPKEECDLVKEEVRDDQKMLQQNCSIEDTTTAEKKGVLGLLEKEKRGNVEVGEQKKEEKKEVKEVSRKKKKQMESEEVNEDKEENVTNTKTTKHETQDSEREEEKDLNKDKSKTCSIL
ncbi:X-linked retinitis pigmentosa GTPase regulator-like [Argonauta hians]